MTKRLISLIFITTIFSQVYNTGETMSNNHQNQSHPDCYGETDYGSASSLRFADYNGATNGGDYHVIFVDMSASW